jgi:alpha-beta hydrolase superfamily lysophospholipase
MEMKVSRMLFLTATIFIALFVSVLIGIYFGQSYLIFRPSSELWLTPDKVGLAYEDVYIKVADGENIHAWYFPSDQDDNSGPQVVFCHGNAGNISNRLETAQALVEMGAGCLMFDYRGYGKSEGSPSETRVYQDGEAAYRWLLKNKASNQENIVIFGRSLGGAVAIELASRLPARGLIVESSFTSM